MLCNICRLTFQGRRERTYLTAPFSYNHHQSALDVQAAANQGCHFCTLLWSLLSVDQRSKVLDYSPDLNEDSRRENDHVQITSINAEDSLRVAFPLSPHSREYETEEFCVKFVKLFLANGMSGAILWIPSSYSNSRLETDNLASHQETQVNTGSEVNFALANNWVNHCKTNHQICGQLSKNSYPWYPTRLLEVEPFDSASPVSLRITGVDPPDGPYLSLSHCWGSALFLKLTTQNIESFKAGVFHSRLPKTFQDAIYITQKLGVKFLWIDALCIIQDSDEDWRREAATMGNVYQNALCNIAATGASDSSGGCFWDRDPLLAEACVVEFSWELPFNGSYYCIDGSLWPKNIGEAPLNRRAWVTQERILSPRIIHFAVQQMFWECHEMEACESFPVGLPESPDPLTFIVRTGLKRMRPAVRHEIQTARSDVSSESRLDGYAYWDGIVDVYTRSSLTRQEDKLIALSGMAKEMSLLLNDEYLAGLWKKHLAHQLLWSVTKPMTDNHGNPCFRPATYQAPTWSWASIDGHVVPGNRTLDRDWGLLPKLLEAYIDAVGEDPTGQISGARLHARGHLRLATWQCLWHGRIYKLIFEGKIPEYSNFWPDEISTPLPSQVYCFPLLHDYWDESRTIDGLVLTRVGSSKDFKRIGRFRYQDEEDCWLLMKSPRTGSAQEHPIYEDLQEQAFTII